MNHENTFTLSASELRIYMPSENEKRAGGWAVIHEKWDKELGPDYDSTVHVIPTFGRPHVIGQDCWCAPKTELKKDGSVFFVHEASQ